MLIIKKILIWATIIILTLMLAEVILQMVFPDKPAGMANYPNINFTYSMLGRNLTYQSNSIGLRETKEFSRKRIKISGNKQNITLRRILMIGDSFVFGSGMEINETIPSQMQELMITTEVINAGGSGGLYLEDYSHTVPYYADKVSPDESIICIYIENDLQMTAKGTPTTLSNIFQHSKIISLTYNTLIKPFRPSYQKIKALGNNHGGMNLAEVNDGTKLPNKLQEFLNPTQETLDWSEGKITQIINSVNGPITWVLIPSSAQINEKYLQYRKEFGYNTTNLYNNLKVQTELTKILTKHNQTILDLTPFLMNGNDYQDYDMHFTTEGFAKVARIITGELYEKQGTSI